MNNRGIKQFAKDVGIHTGIMLAVIGTSLGVMFGFTELGASHYAGKSAPSQYIGTQSVSGYSQDEIEEVVSNALNSEINKSIAFFHKDTKYEIPMRKLGMDFDYILYKNQVKFYESKPTYAEFLSDLIKRKHIKSLPEYSEVEILSTLREEIPGLKPMNNAYFASSNNSIKIVPESNGVDINEEKLFNDLLGYVNSQKRLKASISIETEKKSPTITKKEIEPLRAAFEAFATKDITFKHEDKEIIYSTFKNPEIIRFEKEEDKLIAKIDKQVLADFADKSLKPEVDKEPDKVEIKMDPETEKVTFSSRGLPGIEVDIEKLHEQTEQQVQEKFKLAQAVAVEIPVKESPPIVEVEEKLRDDGIKEMLTSTYTTYFGSTYKRMHNIDVGVSKINGLIVPQGEEFSFNENLGEVTGAEGYYQELVIKSDGTYPEYGGGLCQVSSTLFRTALDAGLNITERSPHSYAVSYYAQVKGHGLDATIYPGVKDVKFLNNTPGNIVIQGYTEGAKAVFNFYGTSDGRKVEYEGPYISNYRNPGPTQYISRETLPPGSEQQVEVPHTGFDAIWYRKIVNPEGNEQKEEIFSRYNAVPAKVLVGPEAELQETN